MHISDNVRSASTDHQYMGLLVLLAMIYLSYFHSKRLKGAMPPASSSFFTCTRRKEVIIQEKHTKSSAFTSKHYNCRSIHTMPKSNITILVTKTWLLVVALLLSVSCAQEFIGLKTNGQKRCNSKTQVAMTIRCFRWLLHDDSMLWFLFDVSLPLSVCLVVVAVM